MASYCPCKDYYRRQALSGANDVSIMQDGDGIFGNILKMVIPALKVFGKKALKVAVPRIAKAASRASTRIIRGENVGRALKRSFAKVPQRAAKELFNKETAQEAWDASVYNKRAPRKRRQSSFNSRGGPNKKKRRGVKYVF